jgi:hypothetical protein
VVVTHPSARDQVAPGEVQVFSEIYTAFRLDPDFEPGTFEVPAPR